MPYFVYRMQSAELAIIKQLELIRKFEKFKEAKALARQTRAEQVATDTAQIKVIFADNQLAAEEMLMEIRDKPIVMEHEK